MSSSDEETNISYDKVQTRRKQMLNKFGPLLNDPAFEIKVLRQYPPELKKMYEQMKRMLASSQVKDNTMAQLDTAEKFLEKEMLKYEVLNDIVPIDSDSDEPPVANQSNHSNSRDTKPAHLQPSCSSNVGPPAQATSNSPWASIPVRVSHSHAPSSLPMQPYFGEQRIPWRMPNRIRKREDRAPILEHQNPSRRPARVNKQTQRHKFLSSHDIRSPDSENGGGYFNPSGTNMYMQQNQPGPSSHHQQNFAMTMPPGNFPTNAPGPVHQQGHSGMFPSNAPLPVYQQQQGFYGMAPANGPGHHQQQGFHGMAPASGAGHQHQQGFYGMAPANGPGHQQQQGFHGMAPANRYGGNNCYQQNFPGNVQENVPGSSNHFQQGFPGKMPPNDPVSHQQQQELFGDSHNLPQTYAEHKRLYQQRGSKRYQTDRHQNKKFRGSNHTQSYQGRNLNLSPSPSRKNPRNFSRNNRGAGGYGGAVSSRDHREFPRTGAAQTRNDPKSTRLEGKPSRGGPNLFARKSKADDQNFDKTRTPLSSSGIDRDRATSTTISTQPAVACEMQEKSAEPSTSTGSRPSEAPEAKSIELRTDLGEQIDFEASTTPLELEKSPSPLAQEIPADQPATASAPLPQQISETAEPTPNEETLTVPPQQVNRDVTPPTDTRPDPDPLTPPDSLPSPDIQPTLETLIPPEMIKKESELDIQTSQAFFGSQSTPSEPKQKSPAQFDLIPPSQIKKEKDVTKAAFHKNNDSDTDPASESDTDDAENSGDIRYQEIHIKTEPPDVEDDIDDFTKEFAGMGDDPEFFQALGIVVPTEQPESPESFGRIKMEPVSPKREPASPPVVEAPDGPPLAEQEIRTAEDELREGGALKKASDDRLKNISLVLEKFPDVEPADWGETLIFTGSQSPDYYTPLSPPPDDGISEDLGDTEEEIRPYTPTFQVPPPEHDLWG